MAFHANLFKNIRIFSINDDEALESAFELTKLEALFTLEKFSFSGKILREKKNFQKDDVVVICLSGRGDKDMEATNE